MATPSTEDFVGWFDRHHARLLALATHLSGPDVAEDIVQTAWAQAWRARTTFRGDASPYSWLYRIVFNTAMSYGRAAKHRSALEDPIELAADRVDPDGSPFACVLRAEQRRAIVDGLDGLPAMYAAAITLVDLEEQDITDVARAFGIPPQTLKSRLHRGRIRLTAAIRARAH